MREGRELRREDGMRRGQLERNPCKTNEGAPDENPAPRPFPHAPLDQRERPRKGCGGCAPPQSIVTGSVFVVMMVIVMATMKEAVLVTLACLVAMVMVVVMGMWMGMGAGMLKVVMVMVMM